jgi:signal transduction histidine kinase
MSPLSACSFGTALVNGVMGGFVLWKAPRRPVRLIWFGLCMSITIACFATGWAMTLTSSNEIKIWLRIMYIGACFFPALLFHFFVTLSGFSRPRLITAGYLLAGVFEIISATGHLVRVRPDAYLGFYAAPQPLFFFFAPYVVFFLIYSHILLWKAMKRADPRKRNQLKYVFLGGVAGCVGCLAQGLPIIGVSFYLGMFTLPIYVLFVLYAISIHQLMDVKIIIRRTFVYSLVSMALAALYLTFVLCAVRFFGSRWGGTSLTSSLIAACVISALFHPLSQRMQQFVDHLFSRKRVEREQKLMEFSRELARYQDQKPMAAALCQTVEDFVQPKTLALYLLAENGVDFIRASGSADAVSPGYMAIGSPWPSHFDRHPNPVLAGSGLELMRDTSIAAAAPLLRDGALLGFLLLGEKRSEIPYGTEDLVLLETILNQAVLAFERPKWMKDITGSFVHEVKTPLARISLPAELSILDIDDLEQHRKEPEEVLPKLKSRMKFIMEQASLAGRRVEAVRLISSVDAGMMEDVNLEILLDQSLEFLQELIHQHAIRVEKTIDPAAGTLKGNHKQLEIVLVNLLKNAIEAIGANAEGEEARLLKITTRRTARGIEVSVIDRGPGIPIDRQALLFKSHFTTKGPKGSGMGLFLSRQIVQAHGGDIAVSSQEGKGTTFTLNFP